MRGFVEILNRENGKLNKNKTESEMGTSKTRRYDGTDGFGWALRVMRRIGFPEGVAGAVVSVTGASDDRSGRQQDGYNTGTGEKEWAVPGLRG